MVRVVYFMITFLILGLSIFLAPQNLYAQSQTFEGRVVQVIEEEKSEVEGVTNYYQKLRVLVTSGELINREIIIESGKFTAANNLRYQPNDKVVISSSEGLDGEELYFITDYVRRSGLFWLFLLFAFLSVSIAGVFGITSLLGMGISYLVIFKIVLPLILNGQNAVLSTILGVSIIIPVTFTLSHGLNKKTYIAIISTIITLVITGLLAIYFVDLTRLTGFATEESGFLFFEYANSINMKGILLSGIIIATLGVLDDITISQASIVNELKSANKKLSKNELFYRSMNVGKDHIASLINTLVLVYTGASLPLLLLFLNTDQSILQVINYEIVADEIVRMLVGSIGLILAVPITSFIAAYFK